MSVNIYHNHLKSKFVICNSLADSQKDIPDIRLPHYSLISRGITMGHAEECPTKALNKMKNCRFARHNFLVGLAACVLVMDRNVWLFWKNFSSQYIHFIITLFSFIEKDLTY